MSDKILDMRLCSYAGKDLHGRVLAGALLADADLSNTNLQEAVLTKVGARGATGLLPPLPVRTRDAVRE